MSLFLQKINGTERAKLRPQLLVRTWLAIYTKPRWEKKVLERLQQNGVKAYCPLKRSRRVWSDRKKWIDIPVISSYVFVNINETEHELVRSISGVVNFVYWLGKPAVIRDVEIEELKTMLHEYELTEKDPVKFFKEQPVFVKSALVKGATGVIKKVLKTRVEVFFAELGIKLSFKKQQIETL
jgi:transcription antitermination factor NusG